MGCRDTSTGAAGPAPEVVSDERDDAGRTHYDRVREYYRKTHEVTDYDLSLYYDRKADKLTDLFYVGDRSMRESGFDPSNRFGPFAVDIIHYAPVCLNSLLFQMEADAAEIAAVLGRKDDEARVARARPRKAGANQPDVVGRRGGDVLRLQLPREAAAALRVCHDVLSALGGHCTGEQAKRVRENLSKFEAPGGLLTSTQVTGSQWDAPFGWAPLQMIAVDGLRRYGYDEDADRIASKFISLVAKEFQEHGTIVEKYDVRRRESDVAPDIQFGYSANQIGFGWTNAAFLDLLAGVKGRKGSASR